MSNSWLQVETPPIEVGRLLAAGVLGGSEHSLKKAAEICSSVVATDGSKQEAIGRAHAVREIGRAALSGRTDVEIDAVKACETCATIPQDERFCTRIGAALSEGDVNGAAEVLVEFDARSSSAVAIDHARGISSAANEIVGVAAVYRNRRLHIDEAEG